jgi:putative transposase
MIKAVLDNTFHVVGKSELKKWPCKNQTDAWRIFSKVINGLQKEYDLTTRAFVLMSNHYHWLCEYKHKEDPSFFEWFHESINFHFLHDAHYPDTTLEWQPQLVRLDNKASYTNTYKYIYRNPVTAGLVFRAEEYSYSTLRYVLGDKRKPFEIEDNMNLLNDPYRIVKWINAPWEEQLYFKYH